MMTIQERIHQLREEVLKHDRLYDEGNPIISDTEYDVLYEELLSLETAHPEFFDADSPTQRVTTIIVGELKPVRHESPMLSQQKITTEEGLEKFMKDMKKTMKDVGEDVVSPMLYLVQEKLDGITIVLTYENGRLTQAVSRGNGEVGEDLTHNVKHLVGVPRRISFKEKLVLRAEAVLPYEAFHKMNENGKYSNPRNLVSGSLRQLDSSKVSGKGFEAIVFDVVQATGVEVDDDLSRLVFVQSLGFKTVPTAAFIKFSDMMDYIKEYENEKRKGLPYMIDGMVIKVSHLGLREKLGYTSKHPRWATAYKFKSMDATTKLLDITNQVGKTGQITPVAELEEVNIDGVNIKRASLHNYELLMSKDIRIGDTVMVQRANDVIPQVVKSIPEQRTGEEKVITPPTHCPSCQTALIKDGENLYCPGVQCVPKMEGILQHFVSRDAMDIDGLGEKTVSMLYQEGFVTDILSIFSLHKRRDELVLLEGFGEKKVDKMLSGIVNCRKKSLHNLIYALSIPNIGVSSSKVLAKEFKTFLLFVFDSLETDRFKERLMSLEDFGEAKVNSVIQYLSENFQMLRKLLNKGLDLAAKVTVVAEGASLGGKTFVITGDLERFPNRKALQAKIEQLGGKVSGSVSTKTDFLINNDNESSSSKNKKAKELSIPIITEEMFLELIGEVVS